MTDSTPPSGPSRGPRPPAWNRPRPAPLPPPVPMAAPGPRRPVTNRIPENLPLVVRPSPLKRALMAGSILVLATVLAGCPLTLVLTADGPDHTSGDIVALVAFLLCGFLTCATAFGIHIAVVASGGPVLAAGPGGLWVKTRPTRGQAIWLPWEAIAQIRRRRWGIDKMIVVMPRDPREDAGLGTLTAVDGALLKGFFGSRFTANVNFADRSEDEILAALRELSAGRVVIDI